MNRQDDLHQELFGEEVMEKRIDEVIDFRAAFLRRHRSAERNVKIAMMMTINQTPILWCVMVIPWRLIIRLIYFCNRSSRNVR